LTEVVVEGPEIYIIEKIKITRRKNKKVVRVIVLELKLKS